MSRVATIESATVQAGALRATGHYFLLDEGVTLQDSVLLGADLGIQFFALQLGLMS